MHDVANEAPPMRPRTRSWEVGIDAEVARRILATQNWPRQRPLRPTHVATLLAAFRAGELTDFVLQFCELPDGRRYLIDGQHRLTMLIEADGRVPAVFITYPAADEAEVERRYLTIDRQSRRTPEDMLIASGMLEGAVLPPSTIKHIARAAIIVHSGFSPHYKRQGLSLIARRDAANVWMGSGEEYAGYVQGSTTEVSRKLWRSSVCSVGLATVSYVFDGRAAAFWEGVARDDGLMAGDPRKTLLNWLRANPVTARASEVEYCRYVARAWNAWYEGRSILKLQGPRTDPGTRPPATPILGTEYKIGE